MPSAGCTEQLNFAGCSMMVALAAVAERDVEETLSADCVFGWKRTVNHTSPLVVKKPYLVKNIVHNVNSNLFIYRLVWNLNKIKF